MITFEAHIKTTLIPTETPIVNPVAVESKEFDAGPDPSKGHDLTEKHVWGTWQNDTFSGGSVFRDNVATAYHGGIGVDTVDYSSYSNTVADKLNLSLKIGMSMSFSGRSRGDTYDSIENIVGTRWNDVIIGDDKWIGNTLDGSGGNDVIMGEAGDDIIIGGDGNDKMWGGSEDDTFVFYPTDSQPTPFVNDIIKDFDHDGNDVMEFWLDLEQTASWDVSEYEYKGADGVRVNVYEETPQGETWRFTVFLEGTNIEDVGADDFVFL